VVPIDCTLICSALANSVTEVGPFRSSRLRPRPPASSVAVSLHLTKLSNAQADAHLQRRSNVIDSWILRHLPRLAFVGITSKLSLLTYPRRTLTQAEIDPSPRQPQPGRS